MFRYVAFGLKVESQIDVGEASADDNGPVDVRIRLGRVPEAHASSGADEEFFHSRFLGRFHIRNGEEIVADLIPGVPQDLLRIVLKGRVMGYLMRQRGWLPLHASGIRLERGAALFIGAVGAGKSTTAAAFGSRGYDVLTDDVAPVRVEDGKCMLQPGRPRLRLCEDAAASFPALDPNAAFVFDKYDFSVPREAFQSSIAVERIYFLTSGDALGVHPCSAMEAVTSLGRECFIRLRRAGDELKRVHLQQCAALAALGIHRRLVRPWDLKRIGELVSLVEEDFKEGNQAV